MAKEDNMPVSKMEVLAEPSRAIPKLTTKIAVARANNNVIITFLMSLPNESTHMIERIVVDDKLADELIDLLKRTKGGKNGQRNRSN